MVHQQVITSANPLSSSMIHSDKQRAPLIARCGGSMNVLEKRNALLRKLESVIMNNPKLATVPNQQGELPIAFVWKIFEFYDDDVDGESALCSSATNNNPQVIHMLDMAWRVCTLFLEAAYKGTIVSNSITGTNDDSNKFRILHAAAGTDCPLGLVKFILKNFPEQAYERDEHGRYALDVAALFQANAKLDQKLNQCVKDTLESKLEMILNVNPGAASVNKENDDSRFDQSRSRQRKYPLHLAASSGKSWEEGMHALVELCPQAVMETDERGLYAYQLSASSGVNVDTVGSTFQLLRSMPACLTNSLNSSKRKINDLGLEKVRTKRSRLQS